MSVSVLGSQGNVKYMSGVISECLGISERVLGVLDGVRGAQGGVYSYVPFDILQFLEATNNILATFQYTWRSHMSQISKCPKVTVILSYWEALGAVSKLRY